MPPQTPVETVPVSNLVLPEARIGRLAYFLAIVPLYVFFTLTLVLSGAFGFIALIALFVQNPLAGLLVLVLSLFTAVYFIYVTFRLSILRLRDLGASASWSLLLLVPFASPVFICALCVLPGNALTLGTGTALRRYALRYVVVTIAFFVAATGVFVSSLLNSPFLPSLLPWSAHDDRPRATEEVQVIGPTPESERENYARQAKFHNNLGAEFTPSGEAVGYVIYAGAKATSSPGYYVENNVVHGPVYFYSKHPNESSESYRSNLEASGWRVGMRRDEQLGESDARSGHTIGMQRTGPDFSCFDTSTKSQNAVIYDGSQVGLETIRDGACSAPVEGVLLSDDGLHYAYEVRDKVGFFVVVDGKRSSNYPYIDNMHFEGSTAVFNAVSNDFLQFLRVLIKTVPGDSNPAASATNVTPGTTITASAPRPTAADRRPTIRIVSPNGGETLTLGDTVKIAWETANLPGGTYLDLELFKIADAITKVGTQGECMNCVGGGLGSGLSAISPIEIGRMTIPWVAGTRYAGGFVDPGTRYILKATLSKMGDSSECPGQFSNCSVIVATDWSDAAFALLE